MMKVALGLGEDEKGLDDESLIVSLYHQMKVSPTCRVVSGVAEQKIGVE